MTIKVARRARRAIARTPTAPITMIRIRKESDHTLHYLVTIDLGRGRTAQLTISQTDSLALIAKQIGGVSEHLSRDPNIAKEQVAALIAAAPGEAVMAVEHGGWKEREAYIGPNLRRGRGWNRYVWTGTTAPGAVLAAGTFGGWLHTVAAPCAESSYLAFALLVALSGPVLAWADLPEGAVFHLAGKSSTGKTTTARVAASIDGPPNSHADWRQSDRCFAETTAVRCDRVAIFNAAEKAKRKDVSEILSGITHGLVEGGSKKYAAAVKASLPDLRIRSPILSNGNRSGAEMARIANMSWDEQEAARFITIPVPPREDGGVVDRPKGKGPGYSADLIAQLEAGMKRHYGRALGRWLDHVWTHRERVNGLIEDFVTAMQPADAYHGRIAGKFGLIYATGIIAVETGFLPWKADLPLRVVRRLYRGALTALQEGCPVEALVALRDALCDPAVFPDIGTTRELVLNDNRVAGFRFSRAEGEFVAIRQESLRAVLGKTMDPSALIGALAEAGVVEGGHGARRGKQLHVRLINRANGCIVTKPRCLVMKADALAAFLEAAGRGRRVEEDAIVVA
ncbi:DUF927 domain-containing protein [Methylobacterium sp. WL30]|uniref:DUF927 domain-containing protein n=1 Tax=unclassified Methylobacterium TaxID=2615210 RepID=UPI0011CB1A83|nr:MULTISPECIES: DUF927 domain-containing protein [unclassified Methylobacterium]TXN24523.1 DUF927 domain-containing protein [Methylobacterium sp. WL93]TXN43368.1 DUF927 domain-containing protein [Methylobacterium sp. WL119]TXN61731.1 DUF927 domain-containing protein [Methylobacterium sp. WL30]